MWPCPPWESCFAPSPVSRKLPRWREMSRVKTVKKGHYFYGGLPLGYYKVTLEVDGKDVDFIDKVRTQLGDPVVNNFDMHAQAQKQQALSKAAESGNLSKDQARGMTAEQKAAFEK